ncbi:hypothetical protein ACJX0J_018429, partial [Zea mays]
KWMKVRGQTYFPAATFDEHNSVYITCLDESMGCKRWTGGAGCEKSMAVQKM